MLLMRMSKRLSLVRILNLRLKEVIANDER